MSAPSYRTTSSISQVQGFFTVQKPAGLLPGDGGQAATGAAPTAYYVDYNPKAAPPWVYSATVATTIVPAQGGGSLLRVDAQVDVTLSCPELARNAAYQVVFTSAKRQWPRIVAGTTGCNTDTVSVGGHQQPALDDAGLLGAEINRLFGEGRRE